MLEAPGFIPHGGQVVIAGVFGFHSWASTIGSEQRRTTKVLMVNLREGTDTAVLKTSACSCAAQFAGFSQVSTKNLQDKEGAYLPTVLRHITAEILAALIRGWLVYIHR